MTLDIGLTYGIILAAVALFISDRLRADLVALLSLLALGLTGLVTPAEALAGFSDPVVVMIAALFVVGEGLYRTGVAERMARLPARMASGEAGLVVSVMLMAGVLSAFLSSTGTVAIMIPVVVGLARERGLAPSRLLIPLSVAALLGGMLTLIGTAPNLIASQQLTAAGRDPFGFFDFTPVGLVMMALGIGFFALVGRRWLPDREAAGDGASGEGERVSHADLLARYGVASSIRSLLVPTGSPFAGRTLRDIDARNRFGVTILDIRSPEKDVPHPVLPETRLAEGDLLRVMGRPEHFATIQEEGLAAASTGSEDRTLPADLGLAEVLLTPRSRLIGKTLVEARFRETYRVTALGALRLGNPVAENPRDMELRFGDTLLVKGPWPRIKNLSAERRDLVVVAAPPSDDADPAPLRRAPVAGAIVLLMMALMTFDLVPQALAVILAAALMALTGAVRGHDAYRSVNWQSVVLIAGVLPMATALENTGGLELAVSALDGVLGGGAPPVVVLGVLFVATSVLSQVMSNTATAVLLAPVALSVAVEAGHAPEPFLMGVAIAASTAFATPIASPVNTLVIGPGGYHFGDFFKTGVALQIILLAATLLVVPLLFPF